MLWVSGGTSSGERRRCRPVSAASNNQFMRDFEAWQASLQDYIWLRESVPGASDLDCILNASTKDKESFLVFEFKRAGSPVPLGQRILLDGLASSKPKDFTVVTVHGPDDGGEYFLSGGWQGVVDKDCLAKMAKSWFLRAKGKKVA